MESVLLICVIDNKKIYLRRIGFRGKSLRVASFNGVGAY